MPKRSRLSRKKSMKKKDRLTSVENDMSHGGILGMIDKVKELGADIPEKAREVTGSGFLHEFVHLEKKPKPLTPEEVGHVKIMIDSGASWDDVSKEFGYRPETLKRLVSEAEVDAGEVRGYF